MTYVQLEDEYQILMDDLGYKIYKYSTRSQFPQTAQALIHFNDKLEAIKSGLYNCILSGNPYSFRILFRCLCEHYLRYMYCFVRNTKEKTDRVGIEFYEYCGADEMLGYINAMQMAFELQGDDGGPLESAGMLKKFYPNAAKISKKQLVELSRKFKYRSIVRYFAQEAPEWFIEPDSFMIQVISIYAELSAFVHGGPSTDSQMRKFSSQESLDEMKRKGPLVFSVVANATRHSAIMLHSEFNDAEDLQKALAVLIKKSEESV